MIYFDGVHLVGDTVEELHDFALLCGLKREWFQDHKRHPHYDVWGRYKSIVIKNGANKIDTRSLIIKIKT